MTNFWNGNVARAWLMSMNPGGSLLGLFLVCAFISNSAAFSGEVEAQSTGASSVDVRVVSDQADSALAILAKKNLGQPITEADWHRLFSSEGYVRLKKREAAIQRPFNDSEFKAFMLSEKTAERAQALQQTLDKWKRADSGEAARQALAYLPALARIRAKIYPMIKPHQNSFVFEVKTDPAIFLYLDPEVTGEQFENTLVHELHHIGYGGSCPSKQTADEISRLPEKTQHVIKWIGAFGEGFAMLAAAGGPDAHPHAASKPEDRARWDRDIANFNDDLKKVENFFSDVLAGKLNSEQEQKTAFSFFGIQGPWYTVGWKMAVTIEKAYGRARLIECMCDHRELLATFNKAAARRDASTSTPLLTWSQSIIRAIPPRPDAK